MIKCSFGDATLVTEILPVAATAHTDLLIAFLKFSMKHKQH